MKMTVSKEGFTLVEILITMVIFATAILSLLAVYGGVAPLREGSRNVTQALSDARTVLEMMRQTSGGGLSAVTATDWTEWAEENDLDSLSEEAITVSYADTNADPLDVTVQVDWTERRRARSATLQSFLTQR